jgi:hypothetical protein
MASATVSGFKQYPIPVGVIIPFAGLVKPAGYLLCDGTAYLQSDYPELFRVLSSSMEKEEKWTNEFKLALVHLKNKPKRCFKLNNFIVNNVDTTHVYE